MNIVRKENQVLVGSTIVAVIAAGVAGVSAYRKRSRNSENAPGRQDDGGVVLDPASRALQNRVELNESSYI